MVQTATPLPWFASSPARRAGFQRDLRSRTAHEDHAARLVPPVLAGSGDVHGAKRRELGRRSLPVTEAASPFLSPPG